MTERLDTIASHTRSLLHELGFARTRLSRIARGTADVEREAEEAQHYVERAIERVWEMVWEIRHDPAVRSADPTAN